MKTKQLRVSTPQAIAGELVKESRYVFNYTATERSEEISLTMPIRAESYSSGAQIGRLTYAVPDEPARSARASGSSQAS